MVNSISSPSSLPEDGGGAEASTSNTSNPGLSFWSRPIQAPTQSRFIRAKDAPVIQETQGTQELWPGTRTETGDHVLCHTVLSRLTTSGTSVGSRLTVWRPVSGFSCAPDASVLAPAPHSAGQQSFVLVCLRALPAAGCTEITV